MNPRRIEKSDSIRAVAAGDPSARPGPLYCTFPSIEPLGDGSWLLCALEGTEKSGPDGRIRVYRSMDEGASWRPSPSPTEQDEREEPGFGYMMCHLTEIGAGHLLAVYARVHRFDREQPLFHPDTNGILYSEVRLSESRDGGQTWSPPRTLDYTLPDMIIPGKAIRLPDGALGLPCEIWHEWDQGFREGPSTRLIRSQDQGASWTEASVMAKDPQDASIYGDPRLTVTEDGRLIALFWRYSLASGLDMPVHRAESADSGKTWGPPEDTGLIAQISSPWALGDGWLAAVYQERFGQPGLKAILSRDEGRSWERDSVMTLWASSADTDDTNPFSGYAQYSFGYSSVVRLDREAALVPFWCASPAGSCIRLVKLNANATGFRLNVTG